MGSEMCIRDRDHEFEPSVKGEINNIRNWCGEHNLMINDSKTKSLFFGKSSPSQLDLSLPNMVDEMKVLGITYHKSLRWDAHVNNITKAAGRRIGVLRYLRRIGLHSMTKKDLVIVYNNYI